MFLLTRRKMIAGASASAAAGLAGCVSTDPNPAVNAAALSSPPSPAARAAMADAVEPNYNAVYAEVKDGEFTVPAVQLSQVNSAFLRTNVAYVTQEAPGTIVVDPANHYLYHVEDGGRATRYGVGVGREGFVWYGDATIKSKQEWLDWYPPKENDGPQAGPQEINGCAAKRGRHARRPRQPAGRPRHVSLAREPRYIFSHSWHQ